MLRFIVSTILIFFGSLVQVTNIPLVNGVKPNISIVLLVVLSVFETDWIKRGVLVLIAATILTFDQFVSWFDAIFLLTALLVIALPDVMPWKRFFNVLVSVSIGTLILNIALVFVFKIFLIELTANLFLAIVTLGILSLINEKASKKQRSRF